MNSLISSPPDPRLKNNTKLNKWKVDVKGDYKGGEICIIRENNYHGFDSYGWYDSHKICIMAVHTLYHNNKGLDKKVWEFAIKRANQLTKEKNNAM